VAVITGGAAGLGEATARLFVRNGARVVIVDIDDEAGERLVTELGDASARYVHCDVRKESDVAAAVTYTVSTFGKLDIYFSNAGIYRIDPIPLSRLSTFFVFSVSVSVSLDSVCVSLSHDESMVMSGIIHTCR
jgi:NAD(P)-dependent dehydrogenase (short-subunit alcohol dehydrogenase family)